MADVDQSETWAVWDLNTDDPWGIHGPAFGPMPREQAERMVADGKAHAAPRVYSAGPWLTVDAKSAT